MKTIKVDDEVYQMLAKMAVPFKETTPNNVLRRLLKLDNDDQKKIQKTTENFQHSKIRRIEKRTLQRLAIEQRIEQLRSKTEFVHPAFLTFLFDKFNGTHGNYKISDIVGFMELTNLRLPSGSFRNPWMKENYGGRKNGLESCQRTIEHFKQTRKFGCWSGKDTKTKCDAKDYCIYHPDHPHELRNKCDLRNGVIWKRDNPDSPFSYGANYIDVIKTELLKNNKMPLKYLLAVFYPSNKYDNDLIDRFIFDFILEDKELPLFTINGSSPSPSLYLEPYRLGRLSH